MKTATLTQDELTGKAQITYKSEARLTELDGQINEATQALVTAQAEIGRITTAVTERKERLAALQNAAEHVATEVQESRSYATVAQGTLGERQATRKVKELEKVSRTAQNDLLKAQEQDAHVSPGEEEQLHQLQAQVETLQADIANYQQAQEETRRVYTRALRELGEGYYRDAIDRIEDLQRNLEQAKQAVLDAQLARDRCLEEARERLADWPDLTAKLSEYYPAIDDPTARIMRAALAYMDTLVADRQQLKFYLPEVRETSKMIKWWTILFIGQETYFGLQQINASSPVHQVLQNKRDLLAGVIAEYEKVLRGMN